MRACVVLLRIPRVHLVLPSQPSSAWRTGAIPFAAPHPRRQHAGPAGLPPQKPSCRRKRPTGVHGDCHRPWGRMPCRRRFRILAAGNRVHGCSRVLPHRTCRWHRILGNMRKVARHRAIRNADRRQPRARRARANPFARVHIEPPDRGRRAFRGYHRAGRARYAHMDVKSSALRPFRMAGRTQGRSR